MAEPSEWAKERATKLWYAPDSLHTHATVHGRIEGLALALDATRKRALEEAARILALRAAAYAYNGKIIADELKTNIDKIRALIDKPPAPPADGKAVAAAMNEVAKRGLRGRHDG